MPSPPEPSEAQPPRTVGSGSIEEIRRELGRVDIYWFDQWLQGRVRSGMRILDAGCGGGRNSLFLLRSGEAVYGVDLQAEAIERMRSIAHESGLSDSLTKQRFVVGSIDDLPWDSDAFDVVLCSAVLHFAPDVESFDRCLFELWRVLRPGGLFVARLASDIGIEGSVRALGERRFALPDGSERFLVNEAMLVERQRRLGAEQIDPIKTTNVQGLRCMTTWVLRRQGA